MAESVEMALVTVGSGPFLQSFLAILNNANRGINKQTIGGLSKTHVSIGGAEKAIPNLNHSGKGTK